MVALDDTLRFRVNSSSSVAGPIVDLPHLVL